MTFIRRHDDLRVIFKHRRCENFGFFSKVDYMIRLRMNLGNTEMSPEFVFHVRNNLPLTDDNLQTVKCFYVCGRSLFKEMHMPDLFVCLLFNVHFCYAKSIRCCPEWVSVWRTEMGTWTGSGFSQLDYVHRLNNLMVHRVIPVWETAGFYSKHNITWQQVVSTEEPIRSLSSPKLWSFCCSFFCHNKSWHWPLLIYQLTNLFFFCKLLISESSANNETWFY